MTLEMTTNCPGCGCGLPPRVEVCPLCARQLRTLDSPVSMHAIAERHAPRHVGIVGPGTASPVRTRSAGMQAVQLRTVAARSTGTPRSLRDVAGYASAVITLVRPAHKEGPWRVAALAYRLVAAPLMVLCGRRPQRRA